MKKIQILWQCFNPKNDWDMRIITVRLWEKKFWFSIEKYDKTKYTKCSEWDFLLARALIKKAFEKYETFSNEMKARKKVYELNYFI